MKFVKKNRKNGRRKVCRFGIILFLVGFYDRFPKTVEVGSAECAVVKTVAGHCHFIPDHTTVVGTDRTIKADIIKRLHDLIHIERTVGGKVSGFYRGGRC